MKKENLGGTPSIELTQTKDILKELGMIKKSNQLIIGFALESNNGIANAQKKIESKNCDIIILNYANKPDSGFGGDRNTITIIDRNGKQKPLDTMSKLECAEAILKYVAERK